MEKHPQKHEIADDDINEGDKAHHRPGASRKKISMHEDVPVWYDCCSCEAEPYWFELTVAKDNEEDAEDHQG
jgi:hypothetical protein